jgi:hypothetical protein
MLTTLWTRARDTKYIITHPVLAHHNSHEHTSGWFWHYTAAVVYVLQLCQHRQPRRDGTRDGVRVHLQVTAALTHTS